MSTSDIPFVLCIDVEPDPREVSRDTPPRWAGYELAQRRLEVLRERIEQRSGQPARFSWFLRFDEQIALAYGRRWILDQHGAHIEAVRARGDALGIHVHPYRWVDDDGCWLSDYGTRATTDGALQTSVDAFTEAFGGPPALLRYGDGWIDEHTLARAEALGIRVDVTMEPGTRGGPMTLQERCTGTLPDLRHVPRRPYRPDPDDIRRESTEGGRGICVLPLSSVRVRERRPWRRPRLTLAPWRAWGPRNPVSAMLDQVLREEPPHLVFAVRTGDWGAATGHGRRMERFFDALLEHPAAERLVACTPEDALARLG